MSNRIRGKNFTVAQKKILESCGFNQEMIDNYLLQKVIHRSENSDNLNRDDVKDEVFILINRTTGRIKEVFVREV